MAELEIKGKKRYIKYLSKHLRKEHPSTKRRMEIELNKKEGNNMKGRVKPHYRKVKGRKTKVRVKGHMRRK